MVVRIGDNTDHLPVDDAFDQALSHLMTCRAAYEDDPRDPDNFRQLAAARATLEDARSKMREERSRLGLAAREVHVPPPLLADSEWQGEWQGKYSN